MEHIQYEGTKLPSFYSLEFLNILFSDYSNLWEIRNLSTDDFNAPIWLEYLDLVSHDMLMLVEMNLSPELIKEYNSYVKDNDWSNDLAIRRSCKKIDKAVKFLKKHFGELKNKKVIKNKERKLRVVK